MASQKSAPKVAQKLAPKSARVPGFLTPAYLIMVLSPSAVLVFAVTANAAHAFLLYAEQALYATNVTAYMTLICSPGIMAAMLVSAWLGPLALALLPVLPGLVDLHLHGQFLLH